MNKPTQITLANSLSVSHSPSNETRQLLPALGEQTLTAKNIVFANGSVQMEIYVDKHWQTLRLATTEMQTSTAKIASADIQLSDDGKLLTILPKQTEINLRQSQQLQSILNLINGGNQVDNKAHPIKVVFQPLPKLLLNQLHASIPINKEVAQLLHTEPGLKAIITPNRNDFTLSVINRFADTLHQQSISQVKLALWLSKLVPQGQMQLDKNTATLNFNNYSGSVRLALDASKRQSQISSPSSTVAQKVQLNARNEQLIIKTQLPTIALQLKNSLAHTFNSLLQKSQATAPLNPPSPPTVVSPLLSSNSPISSWLQHNFADLKTRITDAVRYFENKPFSQLASISNKPSSAASNQHVVQPAQIDHTLLPKSLTRINLAALAVNHNQPLQADISQATTLPKNFHQSPALVQVFQQLKAGLASVTQPKLLPTIQNNAVNRLAAPADNRPQIRQAALAIQSNLIGKTAPEDTKTNSVIAASQQKSKPFSTQKSLQPLELGLTQHKQLIQSSVAQNPLTIAKNGLLSNKIIDATVSSKVVKIIAEAQIPQQQKIGVRLTQQEVIVKPVQVKEEQSNKLNMHLPLATPLKGPITTNLPASQLSLPLEAKLLAPLLKVPQEKPLPNFKSALPIEKQLVAVQIDKLTNTKISDNVDLNRLVNQAFNRMIDSQSLQPLTIQREILSILRPESLTSNSLQNSFSQSLEHLAVGILAAPSLANIGGLNFNGQSSLDALLQVLVPNFKAANPQKLQEQLLQPQSQALAAELSQIKTTISQVNSTPINQQPDTNPLVQFLLPMRLPPDAAQTEISLGQYKKPNQDKLEGKNVWFVRLNFDYAKLGQLQITAELMDKALDCQLLASSQDITAMAHPHLESLRHKLTAHGLQVGEMKLSQGAPQHQAFYQSHAIINIKV